MSNPNDSFYSLNLTKASGDPVGLWHLSGPDRDGVGHFPGNPILFVTLPTHGDVAAIRSRCHYLDNLYLKYTTGKYADLDADLFGNHKRSMRTFGVPILGMRWEGGQQDEAGNDVGPPEEPDPSKGEEVRQIGDEEEEQIYQDSYGYGDDDDLDRDPPCDLSLHESTGIIHVPCRAAYGVTFPLLQPVAHDQTDAHELFAWVHQQSDQQGADHKKRGGLVEAFEMVLVDCDGYLAGRFDGGTSLKELEPHILEAFEAFHQ
ncbi:hypothetical protein HDV00_002394 [Rhizophlyctis rosea]|nr:hypothetical protein HDV00_002394 [Rhizophlyctis rosea]